MLSSSLKSRFMKEFSRFSRIKNLPTRK